MEFNIQLAAKTTAWNDIKTWVPALVAVATGAMLAFCFGYLLEYVRRRRETQNVRSVIYSELKLISEKSEASEKWAEMKGQI